MDGKDDCHVEPFEKNIDETQLENATFTYLAVGGMGCPRCAMRVRNGLLHLEGVFSADVDHETNQAIVGHDRENVSVHDLLIAIEQSGNDGHHNYRARLLEENQVA